MKYVTQIDWPIGVANVVAVEQSKAGFFLPRSCNFTPSPKLTPVPEPFCPGLYISHPGLILIIPGTHLL